MKKTVKKLSLSQETIRRLHDKALSEVQGGVTAVPLASFATTPCTSCGSCTNSLDC